MTYLILGCGPAGISAAEKIRELEPDSEVKITEKEEKPYYKMYIPEYISGSMKYEKVLSISHFKCKKTGIELLTGYEAIKIDAMKNEVLFRNNKIIKYDKLLIAVGNHSILPDIIISDDCKYLFVDSLVEAEKVRDNFVPLDKAIVIGGGLKGLQISVAIAKIGLHVDLFEKEPLLLIGSLNKEQSDSLIRMLEEYNIKISTSSKIKSITGQEVIMSDGKNFNFDHIVFTTGSKPNTELYEDEKILSSKNIFLCDGYFDSYEAALQMGEQSAYNMTRIEYKDKINQIFKVDLREVQLAFWGNFNPTQEFEEIIIRQKDAYKKIVLNNRDIKGFIFIGDNKKVGKIMEFIQNKCKVSSTDLRELLS